MLQYPEFQQLANAYKIYFRDWFFSSPDLYLLKKEGFEQYKYTNLAGKHDYCWLQEKYVYKDKICNQTIDHFATLIQLACWAIRNWYPVIEFNIFPSTGGADVVVNLGDEIIAFEYERNLSNSHNDIWNKKRYILSQGWTPIFVCQSSNLKHVTSAVGEQYTVQRGQALIAKLHSLEVFHPRQIKNIKYTWDSI